MKIQKHIFSLLAICVPALVAVAQKPVSRTLPEAHTKGAIAMAAPSPFMTDAIETARLNSPFMQHAVEEAVAADAADEALINDIKKYAAGFLGTRYRLGASGPSRFDCSGFTSYVFKNFGFALNRDSRSQYRQGESVAVDELRPGDLMFFSSRSSGKGRVGHVAMVAEVHPDGSCTFIHASTKRGVTYQRFPDGGYYSRHYLGARRIVGAGEFAGM